MDSLIINIIKLKKTEMSTLLSDLDITKVIMSAEERHGHETHIVIECISKDEIPEFHTGEETENSVYWWVELENQIKTFETFAEVEKYLLQDAESEGLKWFESTKKNQSSQFHTQSLSQVSNVLRLS